jgi:alpha-1,6-mannosyltransferase
VHLVDTTIFFTPKGGGVPRYLKAKHEWLRQHSGIRHTIVAPGRRNRHGDVATVRTWPLLASYGYRFPIDVLSWRNRLVGLQPDLIEAGDAYGPAWAALHAGRKAGIPVIGFYHSDLVGLTASRLGYGAGAAMARYVRQLYRQFDLVLAPSRYVAGRLDHIGVRGVVRQPLGVDTETFHPERRDPHLRRQLGIPDEARLLIFAGRFSAEKNLPLLLKTFRKLGAPYHLLLVGGGMRMRPQKNVTVLGYQPNEKKLARLIASCDALVHAGSQETFGLVVLEAMACGIPVVGLEAGGVAELVSDRHGVLARREGVGELAEAIEGLYGLDLSRLGAQAREAAVGLYGWGEVMRSLLSLYRYRVLCSWSAAVREVYACR